MSAWPCWTRSTILNSSSPNTVTALCEDSTKRARCEPLGRHKHRDVTGGQVGPPPAEGSVEHRGLPAPGGQHAVDEGHLPLGAQCRVVERRPHLRLASSEGEHRCRGDLGPDDAQEARVRMETNYQGHQLPGPRGFGPKGKRQAPRRQGRSAAWHGVDGPPGRRPAPRTPPPTRRSRSGCPRRSRPKRQTWLTRPLWLARAGRRRSRTG